MLNKVKVCFNDHAFDYTTNVSESSTFKSCKGYFLNQFISFPGDVARRCVGVVFTDNNSGKIYATDRALNRLTRSEYRKMRHQFRLAKREMKLSGNFIGHRSLVRSNACHKFQLGYDKYSPGMLLNWAYCRNPSTASKLHHIIDRRHNTYPEKNCIFKIVDGFIFNYFGDLVFSPCLYSVDSLRVTYDKLIKRREYISASRVNHLIQCELWECQ